MKAVRKVLAFMLAAGLMLSTTTVFASGGYGYTKMTSEEFHEKLNNGTLDITNGGYWYDDDSWQGTFYYGIYAPTNVPKYVGWWPAETGAQGVPYYFDGTYWRYANPLGPIYTGPGVEGAESSDSSDADSSDTDSSSRHKSEAEKEAEREAEARRVEEEKERLLQEQASREAVLLEGEAQNEGFENGAQMQEAREENKSAGEFYNNAVLNTPGVENAVPVAQGGNLVVNGQVTNMTANIYKVTNRAYVDSVRNVQTGTVLNVVDVTYPGAEATVNFYMPGITGEENIVVLQYRAGAWVNVEVAEVRADHVVLNMTGNGVVAFIAQ